MDKFSVRLKLIFLLFLEFAVWGIYLISIGRYMSSIGLGDKIKWIFTAQGIVTLVMPTLMGIVADRHIPAQKVLALCHLLAGFFMLAAGHYCMNADGLPEFGILFTFIALSQTFFMPSLAISNSVAFTILKQSDLDPVTAFPPIRAFGTVGFVFGMLCSNWIRIDGVALQDSYTQLTASGILSVVMFIYAMTLPECPVNRNEGESFADRLGLKAFTLLKERKFAVFFIFSICLGAAVNITEAYSNPFLSSFSDNPAYAGTFAVRNTNALLSLSQISETFCIFLIPFFLKRYGIKTVMLISMVAWTLRFGLFAIGKPDMPGVIYLILSCIVYGVAFNFFNISGSLFVNDNVSGDISSSAQGLFMLATNGLGSSIGMIAAGAVVDRLVYNAPVPDWTTAWYIFAAYSLVLAIAFAILFHPNRE
ncbi:MAG: MFS transporter [Bacteroidaceae bacterium]|nr:MFS transporter [Bacteroidaceae bacterium]